MAGIPQEHRDALNRLFDLFMTLNQMSILNFNFDHWLFTNQQPDCWSSLPINHHCPAVIKSRYLPDPSVKHIVSKINIHCPKSNPFSSILLYRDTEHCFRIRQPAKHPKWKDCDQDEHDYLSDCMLHSSGRSSSAVFVLQVSCVLRKAWHVEIWDRDVLCLQSKGGNQTSPCASWSTSGQIIIFHQPRFPWNKGISLPQLPFGVRSCEVAIIWPEYMRFTLFDFSSIH